VDSPCFIRVRPRRAVFCDRLGHELFRSLTPVVCCVAIAMVGSLTAVIQYLALCGVHFIVAAAAEHCTRQKSPSIFAATELLSVTDNGG